MKKKWLYAGMAAALLMTGFQSSTFAANPTLDVQKTVKEISKINSLEEKDSKFDHINVGKIFNPNSKNKQGYGKLSTESDFIQENEPNDFFDWADEVTMGKGIIGDFSYNRFREGDFDTFKLDITESGYLFLAGVLNRVDYYTDLGFALFDENEKVVYPEDSGYEDGIDYMIIPVTPGTYYIAAANLNDLASYDQYMLYANMLDITAPAAPKVNPVDDNDKVISGKAEANSTVTIKNSSTLFKKATVDSKGNFRVSLAKPFKAGTKLNFTAEDASGNVSDVTSITVLDKTPPAAPKVNQIGDNHKSISGKAEAYSKITIKNGSKSFATANADKNGNFKLAIKPLKAGTKLYFTAADKSKNLSKTTTVTVVDKTPPALKVNNVYKTSKYVSGKTEANVEITVKVGSKTLAKGKANSKGNFKLKIKSQKKNTILTVTAKDRAGNTKQVKVKVK
ncbi:Ig-like domain-containing protein [Neobacillus mesonae]|uniref:Ig-like domain-containing protein n=1 Tax=Neobacillus mesonae TaxID=1193713 RepID=UPI002E227077|nr:Ig-like domain-containing protein [Neobacillus mesonae]